MQTAFVYSYIYLLESNGLYKIGYSVSPQTRLTRLQTGSPCPIRLVHTIRTVHFKNVEHALHIRFAGKRVHREWFALTDNDVAVIMSMDAYGRTPEENEAQESREVEWQNRPRTDKELSDAAETNALAHSLFAAISRSVPRDLPVPG